MSTYFTIGHSTHVIGEFITMLLTEKIEMVVDVRTIPRSRTNPQFNCDTLPIALAQHGIEYMHLTELGGLRGRQPSVEPSPNTFWRNVSFRNYADYALSDRFQAGLKHLKRFGEIKTVRYYVCGIAVVALPSSYNCRLPHSRRRKGDSHYRPRKNDNCASDVSGTYEIRRQSRLS